MNNLINKEVKILKLGHIDYKKAWDKQEKIFKKIIDTKIDNRKNKKFEQTENYILNKGLKDAYMIRLGLLIPENGIKAKTKLYNLFYTLMKPLYPLMKLLPTITTSRKLGLAMINCLYFPLKNKYLDNRKINNLCKKHLKN